MLEKSLYLLTAPANSSQLLGCHPHMYLLVLNRYTTCKINTHQSEFVSTSSLLQEKQAHAHTSTVTDMQINRNAFQ